MYYFLRQDLFKAQNIIEIAGHMKETGELNWIAGQAFEKPLAPQELILDSSYGTVFPDFFDTTIPVMSEKLLTFLESLGINNIDRYPVTLNDKGKKYQGFFAVNVIGSIDAVDLENSEYRLRLKRPYFTGTIVIDENKVNGARFFRLQNGPGFIVVSREIAEELMKHEWSAVLLQPTEEYDGI